MAAFNGMQFTNKGINLQAKAQAGAELRFTRIAVGDGNLGSTSIADLNALINQVKSIDITKLKALTGGKAVIGGVLSNQDLLTGFYWRELGLFAQDPDLGEILYCYGNAGGTADYIPPGGGADIITRAVDLVPIVGNASSISAVIDNSLVYVTTQDLAAIQAIIGDGVLETQVQDLTGAVNEVLQKINEEVKIFISTTSPLISKANDVWLKII